MNQGMQWQALALRPQHLAPESEPLVVETKAMEMGMKLASMLFWRVIMRW